MSKKSNWLKTDPESGLLIGPSGCYYFNEHQAINHDLLHLCGCGQHVNAYNFCRAFLTYFDRRGVHDKPPTKTWIDAEEAAAELIKADPSIAAHVLAHVMTHFDLLEHGGSVGGSWLTSAGERVVDHSPVEDELDER